ncbi:acetylserotonin O-methyltransferase [Streptomyces cellostaticus]|uniref:acetylserotonin O-methyltransferase n=1 Tax=Streptomyces cellostaticus TaxID=67285 RepID=UPI0020276661|nr:acetylserotonin O-methyltransferase [Streptomyces cellostaticus]
MSTDREHVIATATDPVVREFLRMADDSIVAVLPYALSVAAHLGVADELRDSARTVEDLARVLGLSSGALERLLRTLASCGFFTDHGEGLFALTRLGRLLQTDSPVSMRATLANVDSYRAWLGAVDTIATGRPAFDNEFGAGFFTHKDGDCQVGATFDERMRERAGRLYAGLATLPVWKDTRCLLDIGGGKGAVLASVLTANPHVSGILFDRRSVVERAEASGELAPLRDRCRTEPGDFFQEIPGGADAHLMCSVLHDWEDDDAVTILRRSREALPADGRLLICEMLLPSSGEAHPAWWSDLGMMVVLGGRERTLDRYRSLLRRAGLRLSEVTRLPDSFFSVLEARRERC